MRNSEPRERAPRQGWQRAAPSSFCDVRAVRRRFGRRTRWLPEEADEEPLWRMVHDDGDEEDLEEEEARAAAPQRRTRPPLARRAAPPPQPRTHPGRRPAASHRLSFVATRAITTRVVACTCT
eukprot:7390428-Prymnesium_polylepis.1